MCYNINVGQRTEMSTIAATTNKSGRFFYAPERSTMTKTEKIYEVWVDDNYHFMDEDERFLNGKYSSYQAAEEVCKKIVDDFLLDNVKKHKTAEELYNQYVSFGEDPFIRSKENIQNKFSAWDYAKMRSNELLPQKQL